MKMVKEKCTTEREFLRCRCKRCRMNRENMIKFAVTNYLNGIILKSLSNNLLKGKEEIKK